MKRRILIVLAVLVLAGLWASGTFDHALVNVGLNAKPCGRNGFGATFCGQELTEYRERIKGGEKSGEEAQQKITQEAREAERQATREGRETQHRIEAEAAQAESG